MSDAESIEPRPVTGQERGEPRVLGRARAPAECGLGEATRCAAARPRSCRGAASEDSAISAASSSEDSRSSRSSGVEAASRRALMSGRASARLCSLGRSSSAASFMQLEVADDAVRDVLAGVQPQLAQAPADARDVLEHVRRSARIALCSASAELRGSGVAILPPPAYGTRAHPRPRRSALAAGGRGRARHGRSTARSRARVIATLRSRRSASASPAVRDQAAST